MKHKKKNKKKSFPAQQTQMQKTGNVRSSKISAFFVSSGIFLALLASAYQYFAGNISLEFVQAIGRAYEFQLKNDTPSDRIVKFFRVDPPHVQKVVYRITEDIYANVDDQGRVTLPGGNVSYVPAAEFKELDGQKLSANSVLKFRIPPLSSRSWMAPEATIVDVRYELESSNFFLSSIETLLDAAGIRPHARTVRYLVVENYWTISHSTSIDEALHIFCRDNEAMAKSSACASMP